MVDATGQFVVLTHDHPFLHWDLMLERNGDLKTWRLHSPPDSPGRIPAEPLPDHRLAYLDYEGPVSKGRGEVRRWDKGTFDDYKDSTDHVVCRICGTRLNGTIELASKVNSAEWEFHYRPLARSS